MALKACKECKKEISTDAKTCPSCGKKSPHGMSALMKFGGGFLLLVFGLAALGKGGSSSSDAARGSLQDTAATARAENPAPSRPVVDVDAVKLWQDYEANEVAADSMYKGQALRVSGTVASIDKDAFNNMIVGLRSPNEFMPTRAKMSEADAANVARLSKGMRVSLVCEGGGRIIGSPVLSDCRFTQ